MKKLGLSAGWASVGSAVIAVGALVTGCGSDSGGDTGSTADGGTSAGGSGGSTNGGTAGAGNSSNGGAAGSATGGNGGNGGSGNGGAGGVGAAGGSAGSGGNGGSGAVSSNDCFADIQDGLIVWDYDVQGITTGAHCKGTDHQEISGIQRIVYLGDSIMNGTPPTPSAQFVRNQLDVRLKQVYPGVETRSCAVNGARNDDLMASQIPNCFPDANTRNVKTLTLVISGGNDIAAIAQDKPELAVARAEALEYVAEIREAITYLKDPTNFPAGNDVVFANVYEYTDTSADLSSCPLANLVGLSGTWLNGAAVLTGMNEGYAKIAADTGADLVFMMETFCGHGYRRDRADLQCYRGPGAENWFDLTCIHPTGPGHSQIFDLFMTVIEE